MSIIKRVSILTYFVYMVFGDKEKRKKEKGKRKKFMMVLD